METKIARQVGYPPELYEDVRSEKYLIIKTFASDRKFLIYCQHISVHPTTSILQHIQNFPAFIAKERRDGTGYFSSWAQEIRKQMSTPYTRDFVYSHFRDVTIWTTNTHKIQSLPQFLHS
jgi:hypothetical protein